MTENIEQQNVIEIIKEHFGEDNVDLVTPRDYRRLRIQNTELPDSLGFDAAVLIHWDTVTVSNENNDTVEIKDLFGLVVVTSEGKLRDYPVFTRSTFTTRQFRKGYIHSHVRPFHRDDIGDFKGCCFGSNPMRNTLAALMVSYDEMNWRMFCVELEAFTQVESLIGGPYIRMTNLRSAGNYSLSILDSMRTEEYETDYYTDSSSFYYISNKGLPKEYLKSFLKYYLTNSNVKFSFTLFEDYASWRLSAPTFDTVLDITYHYINWLNSIASSIEHNVFANLKYCLIECVIADNNIYVSSRSDHNSFIPPTDITIIPSFKGREYKLVVEDDPEETAIQHVLDTEVLRQIITTMMNILNYRYGTENYGLNKCKDGRVFSAEDTIFI